MGKEYKRKTARGSWTAEALAQTISKIKNKELSINKACKKYGIPSRTLRRHLSSGLGKGPLGRAPALPLTYEKKLVSHIQALERVGFTPTKNDIQVMAYSLAEKMKIDHRFSKVKERAGDMWYFGFMRRNKELVLQQSEGLSIAPEQGMNRKDVAEYFKILRYVLTDNNLLDKPGQIYNVDETVIQVDNKVSKNLDTETAKEVFTATSPDEGENVSVIACCNAEGHFLPPVLILKGKDKKQEILDGLPSGTDVYMNQQSFNVSTDLFYKWFTEHFLPKKGSEKALLLLDGHSSHSNAVELLEVAAENNVILLCFPSHSTHAFQPLDQAFFKPFQNDFNQESTMWLTSHKGRKLTQNDVAQLIGNAWCKTATIATGVSAMRSTGVYPFNPYAIPESFFDIDASNEATSDSSTSTATSTQVLKANNGPSCSYDSRLPNQTIDKNNSTTQKDKRTLVSEDPLAMDFSPAVSEIRNSTVQKESLAKILKTPRRSSSQSQEEMELSASDEEEEEACVECLERYNPTMKPVDWIRCTKCLQWLHVDCTMYKNLCNRCGLLHIRRKKK